MTHYVALLRGINVGGKNRVEMKRLKEVFERAGMESVRTYINSGNVVFAYRESNEVTLANFLETTIEKEFGFTIPTIVRSEDKIQATARAIKEEWLNNTEMKCDVLFLWDSLTPDALIEQLKPREGIDTVATAPGAVVWKIDRVNASRNGLMRIMGTPAYQQVTVRNCNTVRKLLMIMNEHGDATSL